MHKIKHQARRAGWYDNFAETPDGRRTYNIFGRMNPRVRHGAEDEESNLRREVTEGDAPTSLEDRRRSASTIPNQNVRSSTFPQHGYNDASSRAPLATNGAGDFSSSEKTRSTDDEKARDAESVPVGSTEESVSGNANEGGKPRRRRKFFAPFGKKDKEEQEMTGAKADEKARRKRISQHITLMGQLRAVFMSWINILLIAVPVGIALANVKGINGVVIFVVNFIAIIPLAAVLSFSTEELAMYIGEVMGGLLNATFGNAVELIVSIIALVQGKVLIVQTSLIGSMLSNLLLVMGMCFFLGGINRTEQHFNITVAQTASSLLALAIGSLIIPTAYQIFSPNDSGVTPTSRGTAVLLLVVYGCYLIFQLRTHVDMYNEPSQKTPKRSTGKKDAGEASKGIAAIAASGAATAGGAINQENMVQEQEEEEELPQLTILGALITLAVSTVFIALCAEYMVSAINDVGKSVSQEFIGLILLPIVGNAAEHATAVTVAIKDKMDLAIGVAVGSSLQIALLVLPVMVLLNWWSVGAPAVLNFDFNGFLVVILVLSIWLVNYLINDGKSHWLEGVLLMITYLIIAVAAWFYPAQGDVAG